MEEDNKEQNKKNQTYNNLKEEDNNNITPSGIPFHIAYPTPNNYSFIYPFNYNKKIPIQQIPNNINNHFLC